MSRLFENLNVKIPSSICVSISLFAFASVALADRFPSSETKPLIFRTEPGDTQARARGISGYHKIVNVCIFARTYAMDSEMPGMVAKGQYAKSYEENQRLKVNKIEIVSGPKHGVLEVLTDPGPMVSGMTITPVDTYFKMKSTNNYLGRDLAQYAVELSNGKRVLVRSHIYWTNRDSDGFMRCPPNKREMKEMRDIQKREPDRFNDIRRDSSLALAVPLPKTPNPSVNTDAAR